MKAITRYFLVFLSLVLAIGMFASAPVTRAANVSSDVELDAQFLAADPGATLQAILTFDHYPTADQAAQVQAAGLQTHTFRVLPMIAVQGLKTDIEGLQDMAGLRSIYLNQQLEYFLDDSVSFIGADRARSGFGVTGAGVGVAVIDSGVDGLHPDIAYPTATVQNVKILAHRFFTGEAVLVENVPNTDTSSGHGTHVAGTIAGRGTASAGRYTGVAPGASLIGIGAGDALSILFALEGFDYAIANKDRYNIQVISNSWGRNGGEFSAGDPVNVASKQAYDNGMVVVFAAGNSGPGENTLNPYSVAPWVIGVAAGCTTDAGVRDTSVRCEPGSLLARFSSRGIPGDPLYHPTITAPGVWIAATRATTGATINALTVGLNVFCQPADPVLYTCANGTSMATPHISGVVALMLEAKPGLHPDLVKEALTATATPMYRPDGSLYEEWEVGAGYVDAYKAVQKAKRMGAKKGQFRDKKGKVVETYTETFEWSGTLGAGVEPVGAAAHDYYEQNVGEKAVRATVRVEWSDPVQDVDLYVYAPDGSLAGSSGQALTNFEETTFTGEFLPSGIYTVDTLGWLTITVPYNGSFTVERILR
jgi:serine protease AprX